MTREPTRQMIWQMIREPTFGETWRCGARRTPSPMPTPAPPGHDAPTTNPPPINERSTNASGRQPAHACPSPPQLKSCCPRQSPSDPGLGRLTQHLDALTAAGLDVTGLLAQAVAEPRPLPDEHAADALWWRIVAHLGPAALRATATTATQLRPVWTTDLVELLGTETAERVMADPSWPALVAAVHARPTEWSAQQLLSSVIGPRTPELPDADLCPALVWRVATMTDPPHDSDDIPEDPTEPSEAREVDGSPDAGRRTHPRP